MPTEFLSRVEILCGIIFFRGMAYAVLALWMENALSTRKPPEADRLVTRVVACENELNPFTVRMLRKPGVGISVLGVFGKDETRLARSPCPSSDSVVPQKVVYSLRPRLPDMIAVTCWTVC